MRDEVSPGLWPASALRSRSAPLAHELRLQRLVLAVRIGCEAEERARAQAVEVSVCFRFPQAPAACASDCLEDTIPIEAVAERVRSVAEHGSFALIEHLAQRLYEVLRQSCPADAELELVVTKVSPPIVGLLGGTSFRMAPAPEAAASHRE